MRVSVFGLGYVGAVSSGCLAAAGHRVVGVDVAAAKIDMLNRGAAPIVEAEIGELIARAAADGSLSATDDVARAVAETELSLIAVGTPSALPARSHNAISIPLAARIRLCAEPSVRVPLKSLTCSSSNV